MIGDVIAANTDRSILVISEKARITGRMKAGHVIVSGEVTGLIHSDELLSCSRKPTWWVMWNTKRLKCTAVPPLMVN